MLTAFFAPPLLDAAAAVPPAAVVADLPLSLSSLPQPASTNPATPAPSAARPSIERRLSFAVSIIEGMSRSSSGSVRPYPPPLRPRWPDRSDRSNDGLTGDERM